MLLKCHLHCAFFLKQWRTPFGLQRDAGVHGKPLGPQSISQDSTATEVWETLCIPTLLRVTRHFSSLKALRRPLDLLQPGVSQPHLTTEMFLPFLVSPTNITENRQPVALLFSWHQALPWQLARYPCGISLANLVIKCEPAAPGTSWECELTLPVFCAIWVRGTAYSGMTRTGGLTQHSRYLSHWRGS